MLRIDNLSLDGGSKLLGALACRLFPDDLITFSKIASFYCFVLIVSLTTYLLLHRNCQHISSDSAVGLANTALVAKPRGCTEH